MQTVLWAGEITFPSTLGSVGVSDTKVTARPVVHQRTCGPDEPGGRRAWAHVRLMTVDSRLRMPSRACMSRGSDVRVCDGECACVHSIRGAFVQGGRRCRPRRRRPSKRHSEMHGEQHHHGHIRPKLVLTLCRLRSIVQEQVGWGLGAFEMLLDGDRMTGDASIASYVKAYGELCIDVVPIRAGC